MVNVTKFYCEYCDIHTKTQTKLDEHFQTNKHKMKFRELNYNDFLLEKIMECEEQEENYEKTTLSIRKQLYELRTDNEDDKIPTCDICYRSFTSFQSLRTHKRNFHGNSSYKCNYCANEYKSDYSRKEHEKYKHDIGNNICDFCANSTLSSNEYYDPINNIECTICNSCFKQTTGLGSRKEEIWSRYIDKELGTHGLSGTDRALSSIGGCSLYRPDKIYIDTNIVEIGECDEDQHKYMNYSCEEKRISDIYNELGICGKHMYVIRWNPDNYKPIKGIRLDRITRLKIYVYLAKKLRQKTYTENTDVIHIYYMFYSLDNDNIVKNIPFTHIHSYTDVDKL